MSDVKETIILCKETLFLKTHKCIKRAGFGYVCKYCGTPLIKIRKQERAWRQ